MKLNLTKNINAAKRGLLFLMAGLLSLTAANATHIVGGEITYQWMNGNVYTVHLNLYRDCAGIPMPSSLNLNYSSTTCGLSGSFTASLTSQGYQISPICAASLPQSSCNGGSLYGVEKYEYTGIVTLPAACTDWRITYENCCRNGAITNLMSPSSNSAYFSAMINNLDVPFNNSVDFGVDPVNIIYNNTTTNLNWHTYDVDGDSIVYTLTAAKGGAGLPLTYAAGYSFLEPILSTSPIQLSFNGILTTTPSAVQVCVVSMTISEYRNGFHIGEVTRDLQISVINSTNSLPAITGINGTNDIVINGCPGDTILFDVISSDPDPGQTVSLEIHPANPNIAFNSAGSPFPTGTFAWVPATNDVSSQPYVFTITAKDDFCDYYGTDNKLYYVYVNGCNTNDVWPGDANSDGIANLYDLLAVGLAFNDNGPVRPGASTNYTAQPCPNWTNAFMSGINHKHADTDGNGTVDFADTTAIMLNYGQSHPLRVQGGNSIQNVTDLTVTANYDTVGLLTLVTFDIDLTAPVDSLYGLAFRLFFDPALVNITTAQVSYPHSIFGTSGVDMVEINRVVGTTGFVDIALSRINQLNINGMGPVARVTIVTTDNVSGKVTLNVSPMDIQGITSDESPVTVNPVGDAIVIDPNFVGLNEIEASMISVHPVPADDNIQFTYNGSGQLDNISFYDLEGRRVLIINKPANTLSIDISALSKGIYYMKTTVNGSVVTKKLVKL